MIASADFWMAIYFDILIIAAFLHYENQRED